MEHRKASVGPSIQIKGELIGSEDLIIDGRVEGVVRLRDHQLTIGKQAQIEATLEAKSIRIEGKVHGDVVAGERVELASGSTLLGDIVAPRIVISDGARFKGSVDMDRGRSASQAASQERKAAETKAAPASVPKPDPGRKPASVSR